MTNPQDTIARKLVEQWSAEHLATSDDHWGDSISWDTARKIADRIDAALSVPNHSSVGRKELPPVSTGQKRQFVKCKVHGTPGWYDYTPYSLSVPIFVMPCGCGKDSMEMIDEGAFDKLTRAALLPSVPAGVSEDEKEDAEPLADLALSRTVRFTAFEHTDPLAIRMEFATDSERVSAADELDLILSDAFAAARARMAAVLADARKARGGAAIKVRRAALASPSPDTPEIEGRGQ